METQVPSHYLEIVKSNLRLGNKEEKDVIRELETHIEEKVEELKSAGFTEEEAEQTCVNLLGSARLVARQLYEAHSQGTWKQTLLAATPHLLFAISFILNWWQAPVWLLVMLTLVFSSVIYGWWRRQPGWLFTWLGYSLLPVIFGGLLLFYIPRNWSWLAIVFYVPVAITIIYSFTVKSLKQDWLFTSVMLLPIPMVVGWFIAAGLSGPSQLQFGRLLEYAPWIGLSFLILGLSVAFSVRVRKRWAKVTSLLISTIFTLVLIAYYTQGQLNLANFVILMVITVGLFATPAIIDHQLRHPRTR